MDLLWKLFEELFKSESFKAFVVVCIIVVIVFILRDVRGLRAEFDSHVSSEDVTLTRLGESITALKEVRDKESAALTTAISDIRDDIRLILSVLLPGARPTKEKQL